MIKRRRYIAASVVIIAIVITIAGLLVLQKFMNHETNQSARLDALEGRVDLLEAKNKLTEDTTNEILWGGLQLFSDWKQYY